MIVNNNNNYKVFYNFNNEGGKVIISSLNYLNYMEFLNENGCKEYYKQCGILDTYGNKFCYPREEECPINEIKIDSSSSSIKNDYLAKDYSFYIYGNTGDYLYYKIGNINSGIIIISYWAIQNSQPKYINDNNFIFDIGAFKEIFGSNDEEDEDDDDDDEDDDNEGSKVGKEILEGTIDFAGNLIESAVKLHRIQKLINYINEKINEDENNIDYNFKKIYHNEYVKNYIGFKDLNDIKNFNKIDFSLYKNIFPNNSAVIFSITCGIIFLIFIILYIIFIIKEKKGTTSGCNSGECVFSIFSIIVYCLTFFGFYIYFIVIYVKVFNNNSFEIAKSIKADKFIENFLKEFYTPFEKNALILCSLGFFSLSAILYILAWIIEPLSKYCQKNKNININYAPTYQRNLYDQNRINQNNNNVKPETNLQVKQTDYYQIETGRKLNEGELKKEENKNTNNIEQEYKDEKKSESLFDEMNVDIIINNQNKKIKNNELINKGFILNDDKQKS